MLLSSLEACPELISLAIGQRFFLNIKHDFIYFTDEQVNAWYDFRDIDGHLQPLKFNNNQ